MKSLYKRQLIMMVGIVALSFTLLSTAFMLLSYRYIISETRDRLERNAGYIASFTSEYFSSEYYFYLKNQGTILEKAGEEVYRANVQTITAMSDADIIVADTSGEILYASQESFYTKRLPLSLVNQILDQGGYTGITTLNGLYDSGRYIAGLPFTAKVGNVTVNQGLVLVSGDTSGLSEVAGHGHHLLLCRRGGAAHLGDRQLHHLRPPDPAPHRDGRGRPEVWPGRVRRAGG